MAARRVAVALLAALAVALVAAPGAEAAENDFDLKLKFYESVS